MKNKNLVRLFVVLMLAAFGLLGIGEQKASAQGYDSIDWSQCANGKSPITTANCDWINGILNANNSTHYEGMSTIQRALVQGLSGTNHSFTFKVQAYKASGDHHAFDYFTSWDQAIRAAKIISGNNNIVPTMIDAVTKNPLLTPMVCEFGNSNPPEETLCATLRAGTFVNVSGADTMGTVAGDNISASITSYEAATGTDRYVRVYTGGTPTPGTVTFLGYDCSETIPVSGCSLSAAGTSDHYAYWTVTWTTLNVAAAANALIELGAHLSVGQDNALGAGIGYGLGAEGASLGSAGISGGPYHVILVNTDAEGIGSRDNQIQGSEILFPPANITINKVCVNSQSGSFGFNLTQPASGPYDTSATPDFSLACGGSNVKQNISVFGNYTFTETAPPSGWALTDITCTGGGANTSDTGSTATVGLDSGENVVCTFTNTLQQGTLNVCKHVINDDGGTNVAADWSIHVREGGTIGVGNEVTGSPAAGVEPATCRSYTLLPGDYNVTETGAPTGYAFDGYTGDCADASNGPLSGGGVTVGGGTTKTCTLTNNDNPPHLTLVKVVTNNDGGTAVASNWTLSATGSSRSFSGLGDSASIVSQLVTAGVSYTLAESAGPAGYTNGTTWVCTGTGIAASDATHVTVALGGSPTCTITNTDNPATLTLVKEVTNNDGGTAVASNWTLSATGSSRSFSGLGGSASIVSQPVTAGVSYTLAESAGPAGYTNGTTWVCTGTGIAASDATHVTVALGGSPTCTITNTDNPPHLTLVKVVTNNDGGTAVASNWTLSATGSSRSFSGLGDSASIVSQLVTAGVSYTLSESAAPTGYTNGATWVCTGTGIAASDATHVTVALGGSPTCTITNTDNPPQLKLVKTVVNDNGGTAVASNWMLSATGSSRSFNYAGGTNTFQTVTAGVSYTLAESAGPAGYTNGTTWNCTGTGISASDATHVTVALGGSVTCTIINDDIPGRIIVRKEVQIGGVTADAPDNFAFTRNFGGGFNLDDDGAAGGDAACTGGNCLQQQDFTGVSIGARTVSETVTFGWALVGISCANTSGPSSTFTYTGAAAGTTGFELGDLTANVNLAAGSVVTCTFTNNQAIMPLIKTYNGVVPDCVDNDPTLPDNGVRSCTANGSPVPQFSFNLYLDSNPGSATADPCGFPSAAAGTCGAGTPAMPIASVLVAPSFELPGPIGVPFSICEMNPGTGTNGWHLSSLTVDLWILGQNPAVDLPNSSTAYTLYDKDDGAGTTAVCFDVLIPQNAIRFELNADNTQPGGTRTIGYWANWTSCDGKGNQFTHAGGINGGDDGFFLIDDLLSVLDIGIVQFPATVLNVTQRGCANAVDLLKKSDIGGPDGGAGNEFVGDGVGRANDALYSLAAQLIAAQANYGAGAVNCGNASLAMTRAVSLLDNALINFDGTGSFLPPRGDIAGVSNETALRNYALALAGVLDAYNNIHDTGTCNDVPAPPAVVVPAP
jgi:hypothetical protein